MYFDLPTLIAFMGLTSFTLAIAVLVVGWQGRASDGLTAWGISIAVHGLSYPLFALRFHGWLDTSIVLSCTALSATLTLNILALSQFQRSQRPPPPDWALWLPVLATGIVATLTLQHHVLRNVLVGTIAAGQSLLLARLAMHPVSSVRRERSRALLIAGSVALVLLLLVRNVVLVRHQDWTDDSIGVPVGVQAYSYVFALMILVLNTVGFLLMHKDQALEIQREQAARDPLTGLLNRRALLQELQRVVVSAVTSRMPVSLLMIDIDRFKRVNDTLGHQVGDEVLLGVCDRIKGRLRHSDVFARFGGEEFIVVLPDTGAKDAGRVAEAVREVLSETPLQVDGRDLTVTVSVGVRTILPETVDGVADQLIRGSDDAMYRAKRAGRNRVEVYREPVAAPDRHPPRSHHALR